MRRKLEVQSMSGVKGNAVQFLTFVFSCVDIIDPSTHNLGQLVEALINSKFRTV